MAGMATGFLDPNIKLKYKIRNVKKDTFTPAVASFVGNILKDTAVSTGQVANELLSNPYTGGAGAIATNALFGKDALSRLVGRVNADAGKSMRGEVTPMDVANVASIIPIPIGSTIRGGLLGARAGVKFLPSSLKGLKPILADANISTKAGNLKAGNIASLIERGIGSAFIEATPDAILSAPAAIDVSKSDLPLQEKIALLTGIAATVAAPGTGATVARNIKLKKATQRIKSGNGTLTDYTLTKTENTPWSSSDRALYSETSMPAAAVAAYTQGGRQGWGTKWDLSLYDNDAEFRKITDDAVSGKTTAKESQAAFEKWKQKRSNAGIQNPNIVSQAWEQLERNSKTGSLTGGNSPNNASPIMPGKSQRFSESLEGKAPRVVFDSREQKLYNQLVDEGTIVGNKLPKKPSVAQTQDARRLFDDWFKQAFGITDLQRSQAVRERMYQALG